MNKMFLEGASLSPYLIIELKIINYGEKQYSLYSESCNVEAQITLKDFVQMAM